MINNQLPVALRSKLGRNYEIEIDCAMVKASVVVNDYHILSWKTDELRVMLTSALFVNNQF